MLKKRLPPAFTWVENNFDKKQKIFMTIINESNEFKNEYENVFESVDI